MKLKSMTKRVVSWVVISGWMTFGVTIASVFGGDTISLKVLENGLKIGFHQTDSKQILIKLRVGAGLMDEKPGETGVAHWLEHGVFRGTPRFPTTTHFEKEISRLGIQTNASTTFERTDYFFLVPVENLKPALELFSDMIGRPILEPGAMKAEVQAVKQELLRDLVNPRFDLYMASLALHAKTARMAKPMIGTIKEMDEQNGNLPRKFYERWYSADNMTMVIEGDLSDQEDLPNFIKSAFEKIKKFQTPPRASFKGELKNPEHALAYKIKAEPGNRRLLNVAFPLEYTIQNWAAATVLADYLNREDSALADLREIGFIESAIAEVETYQDVLYFRMTLSLTELGEKNIEAVHTMGTVAFGSIQKNGLPQHLIDDSKASLLRRSLGIDSADLITEGLARPDMDFMYRHRAVANIGVSDLRWLATQMPPERAQVTLRTPNASGKIHPAVGRPVETIDFAPLMTQLKQAYTDANLTIESRENPYLAEEKPTFLIAEKEVKTGNNSRTRPTTQVVVIPQSGSEIASVLLEFRFPKLPKTAEELVAIELAVDAFENEKENLIFFDHLQRAGIRLDFRMDKSSMRMILNLEGPYKNTARALEEFILRWRSFEITPDLLDGSKQRLADTIRATPIAEVSRQAVSAGIKTLTGGKFIAPQKKIELMEHVPLDLVDNLIKGSQQFWGLRGIIAAGWEDATIERIQKLFVAPNPIPVKSERHRSEPFARTYKPLIGHLSGVDRQGVARLYPVAVAENSAEEFAFRVFSHVLSKRLMETVRTQMKLVYAVDANFRLLPTGGVLYLTADTSKDSAQVLQGYDRVMDEFLSHGMSEDEFRNAKSIEISQLVGKAGSIEYAFSTDLNGAPEVDAAAEQIKNMKASDIMLFVRNALLKSKRLDSVIVNPRDSLCQKILTAQQLATLELPKVPE